MGGGEGVQEGFTAAGSTACMFATRVGIREGEGGRPERQGRDSLSTVRKYCSLSATNGTVCIVDYLRCIGGRMCVVGVTGRVEDEVMDGRVARPMARI